MNTFISEAETRFWKQVLHTGSNWIFLKTSGGISGVTGRVILAGGQVVGTSLSFGNRCQNTVHPSMLALQSVASNSRISRELSAKNTLTDSTHNVQSIDVYVNISKGNDNVDLRSQGSRIAYTPPPPRFRYERGIFDKHVFYLKSRPPHDTPQPSKFCKTIVTLYTEQVSAWLYHGVYLLKNTELSFVNENVRVYCRIQ